jgi:hypothetical protein
MNESGLIYVQVASWIPLNIEFDGNTDYLTNYLTKI